MKKLKKYKVIKSIKVTNELYLLWFFVFLFLVIVIRLFYLQVIRAKYYENLLWNQHISKSLLKADRWNIFVKDQADKAIQLTENIMMYDVFVDPKFIRDKDRFIELISPIIYQHLCETNGMEKIDKYDCIRNIEAFSRKNLLPQKPEFFYFGSWISSEGMATYDWTGFNEKKMQVIANFTTGVAIKLITDRLQKRIYIGINPRNYLWYFSNLMFLKELEALNLPYIDIEYGRYVYIVPSKIRNPQQDTKSLIKLLDKYDFLKDFKDLKKKFVPQENRYVKLVSDVNPYISKLIKDLKLEYYQERNRDNIPILHGLGLEPHVTRYYPYEGFLSDVLWFVDQHGQAFYGVEQYFDELLAGQDGEIQWRSSAWIGQVWANDFEIKNVKNGDDVYLTVDISIQKEMEAIVKRYQKRFKADSVSILVYDPFGWQIKASASYPSYNPNNYNKAYEFMPLSNENADLVDNETFVDIPIYIKTWWAYKLAKSYQRTDLTLPKYISQNIYGPQVFIDKNIAMAYEPGSIFKAFTMWIGLDTDEVRFYDYYNDPGFVKVGPYTIKNADKRCTWDHSFLHALVFSCNVWMVRVAQRIGKESFYNYLAKLGFGQMTHIELGWEDPGFVEWVWSVSYTRYLNNAFGQGLLVTPLQLAAAYGSLVNGWYYVKPTIVAGIKNKDTWEYFENKKEIVRQIFRKETAEEIKEGLFQVMEQNPWYVKNSRIEWFSLWGKSWTSQISYKWKYQNGLGWTNGSFVGLITKEDTKYITVIQVRRPRSNLWWWETAGKIFRDVAGFLVNYSLVER